MNENKETTPEVAATDAAPAAEVAAPAPVVAAPAAAPSVDEVVASLWPNLPSDESFVEALMTDATMKIDETTMLSGIRAAFADRVSLFDLPETVVEQMEKTAERLEEPCGKDWYDLRNAVTEKKYGEVLAVLGVKGTFISEAKKKSFLTKVNTMLWGSLVGFHNQLDSFRRSVIEGGAFGNPFAAIALISGKAIPYAGAAIQVPSSDPLRDNALGLRQQINKVFAGHGLICARALAYDAIRIKGILENPQLPMYLGYLNRDQMLKGLGVGVAADFVRMERDLAQYALAAVRLPDIPRGDIEQNFIGNLFQLDMSIPWDKLGGGTAQHEYNGGARKRF